MISKLKSENDTSNETRGEMIQQAPSSFIQPSTDHTTTSSFIAPKVVAVLMSSLLVGLCRHVTFVGVCCCDVLVDNDNHHLFVIVVDVVHVLVNIHEQMRILLLILLLMLCILIFMILLFVLLVMFDVVGDV